MYGSVDGNGIHVFVGNKNVRNRDSPHGFKTSDDEATDLESPTIHRFYGCEKKFRQKKKATIDLGYFINNTETPFVIVRFLNHSR